MTGAIGLLGTKPSYDLMIDCDTLLLIGTSFPWSEFLPKEGQARAVQIDLDPGMLGLRYPAKVNLHGDAAETLRALLPRLEAKRDRGWQERIVRAVADWWKTVEQRAMAPAEPVNPQRVVWEMSPLQHLPRSKPREIARRFRTTRGRGIENGDARIAHQ